MCKWQRVISRHKGSPRYWIAHGWENEFGSFNFETLKLLIHFREPGSSHYFIYTTHTHIYIYISHTYIFFIFFILSFIFHFLYTQFFLLSFLFLFAPLELKLHRTYHLPHA
jgi:hypothetical protein